MTTTELTAMITAIDEAVLAGIDKPGKVISADGRSVEYRDLDSLMKTRGTYVRLQNAATRSKKGFTLNKFRAK